MSSTTLKVLASLVLIIGSVSAADYDYGAFPSDEEVSNKHLVGRQFVVSNISAVITYVSFVVALVMLAGFAWVAFAFRGSHASYGHYDRRGFDGNDINWQFYQSTEPRRFKRSKDMNSDQELAVKLTVLLTLSKSLTWRAWVVRCSCRARRPNWRLQNTPSMGSSLQKYTNSSARTKPGTWTAIASEN